MTIASITARIDTIMSSLLCRSSALAAGGKSAVTINNDIIMLSNIRAGINPTWTAEMIENTDCFIRKYE